MQNEPSDSDHLMVLAVGGAQHWRSKARHNSAAKSPTRKAAYCQASRIVITNEDTGIVREITSTAEGSYFASQMVPGRYRITAKLEGFKALDRRGVIADGRTDAQRST